MPSHTERHWTPAAAPHQPAPHCLPPSAPELMNQWKRSNQKGLRVMTGAALRTCGGVAGGQEAEGSSGQLPSSAAGSCRSAPVGLTFDQPRPAPGRPTCFSCACAFFSAALSAFWLASSVRCCFTCGQAEVQGDRKDVRALTMLAQEQDGKGPDHLVSVQTFPADTRDIAAPRLPSAPTWCFLRES